VCTFWSGMRDNPLVLQRQMDQWPWPVVPTPDGTRIQNICGMCCITAVWIIFSLNTNINIRTGAWIWRRATWNTSTTFRRNLCTRLHDAAFQKIVILRMYGFVQFWHKLNLVKEVNSMPVANVLTGVSIVYLKLNICQYQCVNRMSWAGHKDCSISKAP
jgi:hypothetical protein